MEFNIEKSQFLLNHNADHISDHISDRISNHATPQNFGSDFSTKQTQSFDAPPQKKALIKASLSIADLWAAVQESYDSEWRHQEFILACNRAGCLYYASQKYARILSVSPTENIAMKMQGQIEALASRDRFAKTPEVNSSRPSQMSSFIALLGLVIASSGFINPSFRNLVGVGISIFVLGIGIRYFVTKP